jgi:hypothetical protein
MSVSWPSHEEEKTQTNSELMLEGDRKLASPTVQYFEFYDCVFKVVNSTYVLSVSKSEALLLQRCQFVDCVCESALIESHCGFFGMRSCCARCCKSESNGFVFWTNHSEMKSNRQFFVTDNLVLQGNWSLTSWFFESRTDAGLFKCINVTSTVSKEGVLLQLTNDDMICQYFMAVNLMGEYVIGTAAHTGTAHKWTNVHHSYLYDNNVTKAVFYHRFPDCRLSVMNCVLCNSSIGFGGKDGIFAHWRISKCTLDRTISYDIGEVEGRDSNLVTRSMTTRVLTVNLSEWMCHVLSPFFGSESPSATVRDTPSHTETPTATGERTASSSFLGSTDGTMSVAGAAIENVHVFVFEVDQESGALTESERVRQSNEFPFSDLSNVFRFNEPSTVIGFSALFRSEGMLSRALRTSVNELPKRAVGRSPRLSGVALVAVIAGGVVLLGLLLVMLVVWLCRTESMSQFGSTLEDISKPPNETSLFDISCLPQVSWLEYATIPSQTQVKQG